MDNRSAKRRIYQRYREWIGQRPVRSRDEQAWLDVASVGREFGSPEWERLAAEDVRKDPVQGDTIGDL